MNTPVPFETLLAEARRRNAADASDSACPPRARPHPSPERMRTARRRMNRFADVVQEARALSGSEEWPNVHLDSGFVEYEEDESVLFYVHLLDTLTAWAMVHLTRDAIEIETEHAARRYRRLGPALEYFKCQLADALASAEYLCLKAQPILEVLEQRRRQSRCPDYYPSCASRLAFDSGAYCLEITPLFGSPLPDHSIIRVYKHACRVARVFAQTGSAREIEEFQTPAELAHYLKLHRVAAMSATQARRQGGDSIQPSSNDHPRIGH